MDSAKTTKPIDKALRELMDEAGLGEADLAARTTLTQGTVNKYLRSRRGRQMNSKSLETVRQLAAAFALPPEYFREYREWKAKRLVEEAMTTGLLELEDIELIVAEKRLQRQCDGD